ncbi:CT583 family protein [Candidatus Protochlamydia phocaeensis]|uniref:CT583 family protein n=1 Tax=Candidatus Protochlamydia phocaeensis TaxID=1414722 RepID=UPI000838DD0F|nr:CT583 family protein [Candidatus Protochlamydia phocaeensis]
MADVNSILTQRIKKSPHTSKMAAMAQQSATGNLTSFAGVFSVSELSDKEKLALEGLLTAYAQEESNVQVDLQTLISLTSEVKAINNQAAILHGERIKKAHQLLIRYRDGAFTAWLIAAYGNRQTPYNLMQYYDFWEAMPKALRPQIEEMPRQAVYVLASRTGSLEKKQEIVANYRGESKTDLLTVIRHAFPLDQEDKRQQKMGAGLIQGLQRLYQQFKQCPCELSAAQKEQVNALLQQIQQLIA